jgi:hypothetical protein
MSTLGTSSPSLCFGGLFSESERNERSSVLFAGNFWITEPFFSNSRSGGLSIGGADKTGDECFQSDARGVSSPTGGDKREAIGDATVVAMLIGVCEPMGDGDDMDCRCDVDEGPI